MLPLNQLVTGTLADAVGYLSERAARARSADGLSYREKQAAGSSDILSALGDQVRDNPVLGKALLGGGLGAAAGAGAHWLGSTDDDEEAGRRPGLLSKALTGGMAGAALGGGLGLAQKYIPHDVGGSIGGGGDGGPAPGVEHGAFTLGGRRFRIDPKLLRQNPELLAKVNELSSAPWHEKLPAGILRGIFNNPLAPTTTPILAAAGLADIATHQPWARTGDRNWLWPLAKLTTVATAPGRLLQRAGEGLRNTGWTGGRNPLSWPAGLLGGRLDRPGPRLQALGERLRDAGWFPGRINPEHSRNIQHGRLGIDAALQNELPFADKMKETLQAIRDNEPLRVREPGAPTPTTFPGEEALRRLAANPRAGLDTKVKRMRTEKTVEPFTDSVGGVISIKHHAVERQVPEFVEQHMSSAQRGQLFAGGAGIAAGNIAQDPSLKAIAPSTEAAVYRDSLFGGDRSLKGPVWKGPRLNKRLAFYGLPLAAEFLGRNFMTDVGKSKDLSRLLADARARGYVSEE